MTSTARTPEADQYWMGQALAMAKAALYNTTPNPRVGCVIVRDGHVLGGGATQPAGQAHAEVMALAQARQRHGDDLSDATVYVSLEPCSHHGRTPPCVDALIDARPARVVIAMQDPNPVVGGRGIERLREAGIAVTMGVEGEQALALNPGFATRMLLGRPWVWLKLAASMDGYIALPNGESKWITGAGARADGHAWRARSCVVLTGSGTVLADDPQLTVRDVPTQRQPIRAVVDTFLEIPEDARLFDGGPVWVFTTIDDPDKTRRLADRNVEVIVVPGTGTRVDLQAVLAWMAERQINEVHVEAGSRLSGTFLDMGCVDELLLYLAPVLLADGIPMARMEPLTRLAEATRFTMMNTAQLGEDLRICLRHPGHWKTLCRLTGVEAGDEQASLPR